MSIGYTIRKTGNVLLTMAVLAGLFDVTQAYARVSSDPKQKVEFDNAPVLATGNKNSKANMLGKKLCFGMLPTDVAFWGLLMGFVPGKKKEK